MEKRDFHLEIAKELYDKKAMDIKLIDIKKYSSLADYIIVASGYTSLQVKAIADYIIDKFESLGLKALRVEGLNEGKWVVVDFGHIILHIFQKEEREFYKLERLWEFENNIISLDFTEDD